MEKEKSRACPKRNLKLPTIDHLTRAKGRKDRLSGNIIPTQLFFDHETGS